ncbi:MAG TPA: four-carbon acid sugar kinase family protein [Methylomirabilota bacterium]|jgi:uncharacterized protein YgbK (DUF1537 family)|nr:four-carbon acid sugar kinase family protein [Methylomirabilota bacterium]
MLVTLIADDLTGACDAGAPFAGRARVTVVVDETAPGPEWEVAVADTESRALDAAAAALSVTGAARRLAARLARSVLFKKIDSTLRGPVGAELEALLSATGRRTAIVCPAFPDQSRTVSAGIVRVAGRPAHESPVGRDPAYPGSTSSVAAILRSGTRRPVASLPLARVRGGREEMERALAGGIDHLIVADAETNADLHCIADVALAHPDVVLAGSAGLAGALAASLGYVGAPALLPRGRAWLIVAGSLHPATRAQLLALEGAGVAGIRLDDRRDPDIGPLRGELEAGRPVFLATGDDAATARAEPASRLARLAAEILDTSRPDLVAVTGGQTAFSLLRALGAGGIELVGAPSSGLGLGRVVGAVSSSPPLLTKGGGFGAPDLFVTLLERCEPSRGRSVGGRSAAR